MKNEKLIFITYFLLFSFALEALNPFFISLQQHHDIATKSILRRIDIRLPDLESRRVQVNSILKVRDFRHALEKIAEELQGVKRQMSRIASSNYRMVFLKKKLSLLGQEYQVLNELDQVHQQMLTNIDAHIKTLKEYASNENFDGLCLPMKSYYDFDDLQQLAHKLLEIKAHLVECEKSKLAVIDDINKRKRSLALVHEEYQERKKQQESFGIHIKNSFNERDKDPEEQGELLDREVHIIELKNDLSTLKVDEGEFRLSVIEDIITILKSQLNVLKKEYARVQNSVQVSTTYVKKIEEQLDGKRQAFVLKSDQLNEKIRMVLSADVDIRQKIYDMQKEHDISASEAAAIRLLHKEPRTISEWKTFIVMANLLAEESLLRVEHEYLMTQMDLERAQFNKEEGEVSIVRSWYKMTSSDELLFSDDEINQELKSYVLMKADMEAHIVALTNARDSAILSLQSFNESLDNIKPLLKLLRNQRQTIFNNDSSVHDFIAHGMYDLEEKKRRRLNWVAKLIEAYSTIIIQVQNNIKKIDTVIDELKVKTFWKKSNYSIRIHTLHQFFPDIARFAREFRYETKRFFSVHNFYLSWSHVIHVLHEPWKVILFTIDIIILIMLFFILKLCLPDLLQFMRHSFREFILIRPFILLTALCIQFFYNHLKMIYFWWGIFFFIKNILYINYLVQVYYFLSIPYGLYLASKFFNFLASVRKQSPERLISDAYSKKFFWIISTVTYISLVLFFLKNAFSYGMHTTSQVPHIFMALIFMLFQIALIILLDRQQILKLLRSDTPLWEWIHVHVEKYYHVVWTAIIGIIAVSNPYIGYGRQIIYIFMKLVLIGLLLPFISWAHGRVKRISLDLFFYYTENDEIRERFVAGRLWYGIFIISSLLIFLIFSIYSGAKIWGIHLTFKDMAALLNYSFYNLFDETGHEISVTVASLLQIVLYVVGGIGLAGIFNRFVLKRVLDPLLVEPGIQNTILTLVRYITVIIAVFMGLTSAGLEGLTTKLAILIAGIGFAVQEAVRDFLAYFILLVQRPVKIGDLIEILDGTGSRELMGVVRHITPRSLIIRRKNSVTVIIPNSRAVMYPVVNWSYSRTFFAFDDIFVTVSLQSDPDRVRHILFEVLAKNINILKSPAPIVRLDDFLEHGFRFMIRGYLTSDKVSDQFDIASSLRFELVRQLRSHAIEIASPVRTIKLVPSVNDTISSISPDK